jgi:pyruvate/2-oxoglutarate dehydrogenase complex dihydrolipoamide acyltransferase (E2) component
MLTPVRIPDLGAGGLPLVISAWFVEADDPVEPGDPLLEVCLPGVTCDVAATVAGRVAAVERDLDAPVREGDIVAWIQTATPGDVQENLTPRG